VFHEGRQSVIRNLNVSLMKKSLEVGIGTGLALPMSPVIATSSGSIFRRHAGSAKQKAAEHQMGHVQLHRMDAGAMEFKDDSFDTVVAARRHRCPRLPQGRQ
jgi:phosphatidylethanolamine/phosphatidyl-N-methylethanolamine N-methyltransferase